MHCKAVLPVPCTQPVATLGASLSSRTLTDGAVPTLVLRVAALDGASQWRPPGAWLWSRGYTGSGARLTSVLPRPLLWFARSFW